MHFYASGPQPAGAPFRVPEATVSGYRTLMQRLGIWRVLVVQSMLYGADNTVMLEALAALGPDVARGIAVTAADASDEIWDGLSAQGVIGLRAFLLRPGILDWSDLPRLGDRLAERGWQLHLQCNGHLLSDQFDILSRLRCPLVIDHVGKFIPPVATGDIAFQALMRLVAGGHCWVKLSGLYETSVSGGPDFADVAALASSLVNSAPERMLWASNWPHPNLQPAPDDAELLDGIARLAGDNAVRAGLLHGNADYLFGFAREGAVQ
jgi:D-galactarolactone isomerase